MFRGRFYDVNNREAFGGINKFGGGMSRNSKRVDFDIIIDRKETLETKIQASRDQFGLVDFSISIEKFL